MLHYNLDALAGVFKSGVDTKLLNGGGGGGGDGMQRKVMCMQPHLIGARCKVFYGSRACLIGPWKPWGFRCSLKLSEPYFEALQSKKLCECFPVMF